LAVDVEIARGVFDVPFGQIVADDAQIQLIVVDMALDCK